MTATKARDVTPSWLLLQGFTHVCNVGLEAVFQKELPTVQMPVVVTLMLIRGACLSWPPNAVKDHATQQDISLFLMALSDNGPNPGHDPQFFRSPEYCEYVRLLARLYDLIAANADESLAGDQLRDQLDACSEHFTDEEIASLSGFAADYAKPVTAESLQSLGAVYEGQQWCFGKAPRILQVRLNQKHLGGENSWWLTTSESVVGDRVPQAMVPRNVYEAKLLLDRLGISYEKVST